MWRGTRQQDTPKARRDEEACRTAKPASQRLKPGQEQGEGNRWPSVFCGWQRRQRVRRRGPDTLTVQWQFVPIPGCVHNAVFSAALLAETSVRPHDVQPLSPSTSESNACVQPAAPHGPNAPVAAGHCHNQRRERGSLVGGTQRIVLLPLLAAEFHSTGSVAQHRGAHRDQQQRLTRDGWPLPCATAGKVCRPKDIGRRAG